MNNWAIQELLLVDLAKTKYTSDDEGLLYIFAQRLSNIVNELYSYSDEFPNHL